MSAGPRTVEDGHGLAIVAFATATHDVAYLSFSAGVSSFTDVNQLVTLPSAADAPVPFLDGYGRLNLSYVDTRGHLMLVTNEPVVASGGVGRPGQFLHRSWLVHDLTVATVSSSRPTGVLGVGQLDARSNPTSDTLAVRTPNNELVVITLNALRPFSVTATTVVAVSMRGNPTYVGPLSDGVLTLAAVSVTNHLDLFRRAPAGTWTTIDLTVQLRTPTVTYAVAAAQNNTVLALATIANFSGNVILTQGTLSKGVLTWSTANLTALTAANAAPGPALAGQLSVTITPTFTSVAGRAADWGNLFAYTNTGAKGAWVVADVSTSGGIGATTVGSQVAAVDPPGGVNFFAGGVASPAPPGVGIYDVPYNDLPHVISDGWPVLGITGGLGTTSAPWVQTRSGTDISYSPDFQIGKVIQNSRKRTTWLSFWTFSGPQASETASPGNFQAHAYAAGAAIAQQIDQYGHYGLNLKPDWVILDPEGYPDLHSQLDGFDVSSIVGTGHVVTVTTSSATTLVSGNAIALQYTGISGLNISSVAITVTGPRTFTFPSTVKVNLLDTGRVVNYALLRTIWSATLTGWRDGLASIDPSLNPGVYADEYEYLNVGLANQAMPVFMAIAWYNGPPIPIAHSSNVLGYIEFGNLCISGLVQTQLQMFSKPAWNGLYNTTQYNPPGYCTPTTP